jgi:hypothetical protein
VVTNKARVEGRAARCRAAIGRRPDGGDPVVDWVHHDEAVTASPAPVVAAPNPLAIHTARLTLDVTPALRGRIKVTAFRRGLTAAEMLRELLEREYPEGAP